MILYGIPTCDTCRKALKALEATGRSVELRDVRQQPLSPEEWAPLVATFGDALVNRRSTTWRELSDAERDAGTADLLVAHPTLMKRPVIDEAGRLTLGWDASARAVWRA